MKTRRSDPGVGLPGFTLGKWFSLSLATLAFLIPLLFTFEGLSPEGHRVFAVFLLAIVLWVTEAIPLHATAAVIIFLQILMISTSGVMPLSEDFVAPPSARFFATLADPILILFLGGFFLADGASKFKFDRNLARVLLKPFGKSPRYIMLGMMLITAAFSMFMSNTATTATMMALVIPVIMQFPAGNRMRAGIALCIPFAANIGGLGTPIGTPPNAIALGALAQRGIAMSFVQWMIMVIPLMLALLAFAWVLMCFYFRDGEREVTLAMDSKFDLSIPALIYYGVFGVTVLLWMTEALHGMSASVVGFVPVTILLATRVFTTKDLQGIAWHVLWLVAGGIALGIGVGMTGLDRWLVGLVGWDKLGSTMLVACLILVTMTMASFISNSATANLLVPIGMSLATSGIVALDPMLAVVFIALASSVAMPLPISTPPNAIAMSTGTITVKDMATVGLVIGAAAWALFVFVAPVYWSLIGIAK